MRITVEGVFRNQDQLCDETAESGWNAGYALRLALIASSGLFIYGFSMGVHSSLMQALSSAVKLPIHFILTMAVTLPAFHFISLHLGSRNTPGQTLLMLGNGAAIMGVLAAAFSPIALFFTFNGSSYPFLVLLHVTVLGFCALCGASAMHHNLTRLQAKSGFKLVPGSEWCFPAWLALFGIVGTQLGYMLRPFIGSESEFVFLRPDPGNFFEAIMKTVLALLFRTSSS